MSHWDYPLHASFELPQNCSHNSCENASTKLNLRVECHERHKMIIVISPLSFYHLLLSAGAGVVNASVMHIQSYGYSLWMPYVQTSPN